MRAEAGITIALAGNPNSGKTTLFNRLTGERQHVGNWPGKTVECKQGSYDYRGCHFEVVDLPGTYSLAAYSEEEAIARNYLLENTPDLVISILDATNLERHLYLTLQILEMGVPCMLALNMSDLADKRNQTIDIEQFSEVLGGLPVLRVAATKGEGVEALKEAIWTQVQATETQSIPRAYALRVDYPHQIERELDWLETALKDTGMISARVTNRWLALELLANGHYLAKRLDENKPETRLSATIDRCRQRVQNALPDGPELHIADARFREVGRLIDRIVVSHEQDETSWRDRIDRVVTHPVIGIPIFLTVMYLAFRLVVDVSEPYLDWIDAVVNGPISTWSAAGLSLLGAPVWIKGLVVEGVIAGVGGVLVFLPGLMALFFFIAILEDSGYLSRAAFVMNRFLTFLGLNGKSFVPLILGFGCAVPAIYATRTLRSRRDRLLTALMVPLMSCSARLPVYVLFSMALFGRQADRVIWGLYAFGVLVAIAAGWVFSRTLLKTEQPSEFLMELPEYRLPAIRGLYRHVSVRTNDFLKGAGTVILLASVIIWGLLHIPINAPSMEQSLFGRASAVVAPVFRPAGFGSWEASASLMSGLVAKEVVVSTMSEIYLGASLENRVSEDRDLGEDLLGIATGFVSATLEAGREVVETLTPGIEIFPEEDRAPARETALGGVLSSVFSPLSGLAFLVYVLLYTPCIATLSVIRSEFGTSWAVFSAFYQTGLAWLAAIAVYQSGLFFG